jgi:hypothetical protein
VASDSSPYPDRNERAHKEPDPDVWKIALDLPFAEGFGHFSGILFAISICSICGHFAATLVPRTIAYYRLVAYSCGSQRKEKK